jgi:hypothetical protein
MNSSGDRVVDQVDRDVRIANLEHELAVTVITKLDRDRLLRIIDIPEIPLPPTNENDPPRRASEYASPPRACPAATAVPLARRAAPP